MPNISLKDNYFKILKKVVAFIVQIAVCYILANWVLDMPDYFLNILFTSVLAELTFKFNSKSKIITEEYNSEIKLNNASALNKNQDYFQNFVLRLFSSYFSSIFVSIALISLFSLNYQFFVLDKSEFSIIPEIVIATIIGIVLHLFVKKQMQAKEN